MTKEYEHSRAIMEGERNAACDGYFAPRPQIDTLANRRIFEAGFGYGYTAQEARIAALTTQEEIRKQLESETFEEYDWFYKLKFICRVLGNDGNAPKEDWKTAYGMARSLFDSAWLVQREKTELTKDAEPLYQCMNVTDVNQLWRDISKETFDSLNKTGFQSTRILYTHPPAPKAITADMVTDEMLDAYFALDGLDDWRELAASLIGAAKKQCAEIVNAFNGVKP